MPKSVVVARDLAAGYRRRPVLFEVNLDVGPGVHVLLGPDGAGKTTLLRTLSAVLAPYRGHVLVQGRDPHRDPSAKRLVGVAAHRAASAPRLSVRDTLLYWGRVLALPAARRERRIADVTDQLGLDELADRTVGTLSRGQTQRVSIAKALLADPAVLLLDEPLSGVEPVAAARLRAQLRALGAAGRAVVASTHDLREARGLADDVTVLHQGRVLSKGRTDRLRPDLLRPDLLRADRLHTARLEALLSQGAAPRETAQEPALHQEPLHNRRPPPHHPPPPPRERSHDQEPP